MYYDKDNVTPHEKKACELFLSGYNCAQAVFAAFSDITGISEKDSARMISAFGGGMSGQRRTCGTVSAMLMVAGCLAGYSEASDYDGKVELYKNGKMLCEEFGGEVPDDIEQMMRLPGVGRKTANVVGAVIWGKEVMPVDTHIFRVSARIGLSRNAKTPRQTELQLEKHIPSHLLPIAHHWLLLHGRYVCTARSPKCNKCGIAKWCASFMQENRKSTALKERK